jgi:acyl-CoA synthetase (AMP-forming)/AMP-acid ligase II
MGPTAPRAESRSPALQEGWAGHVAAHPAPTRRTPPESGAAPAESRGGGGSGTRGTLLAGSPEAGWADRIAAADGGRHAGDGTEERDDGNGQPGGTPDTPHLVLFTSGTSGTPKAAVLTQRRSLGDAYGAALASGVRPDDRLLASQPLFHTGGWDFLKQYLLAGGSAVLMRRFNPETALDLIGRHRCTAALPALLAQAAAGGAP